jgi:broad specificity phosphatase PhoE
MSLYFVRHGQASAGSEDYDRLSPRGVEQSRRLGEWLLRSGHEFQAVVVGGMRRHRETWEGIASVYAAGGKPLPEARIDPGFDEFDHHAVFDGFRTGHPDHPTLAALREGGLQAFGAMIHAALGAWSEGRIAGLPETWQAFGERVRNAAERLAVEPQGNVLVLTSGGVISRLAQAALGASDRGAVDMNLALRNSALCEFHLRPYGLALGSWNALPHLHDARELWTYY